MQNILELLLVATKSCGVGLAQTILWMTQWPTSVKRSFLQVISCGVHKCRPCLYRCIGCSLMLPAPLSIIVRIRNQDIIITSNIRECMYVCAEKQRPRMEPVWEVDHIISTLALSIMWSKKHDGSESNVYQLIMGKADKVAQFKPMQLPCFSRLTQSLVNSTLGVIQELAIVVAIQHVSDRNTLVNVISPQSLDFRHNTSD